MSLWSRISNVFRADRLNREIAEEFEAHIAEAIEQGRDAEAARRALGAVVRQRQQSHDVRVVGWLDSLRADVVFGWRQLKRNKVTSAAAILSLALAIGACAAAFRLIDALLLRPLPVAHPERLYVLSRQGMGFDNKPGTWDSWAYPDFQLMRAAAKGQAELIVLSYANRSDVMFLNDGHPIGRIFEKASDNGKRQQMRVLGVVRDAYYSGLHGPILPVAYVPFHEVDAKGEMLPESDGTFIVRTASSNPLALASILRQQVSRARSAFHVSNIETQLEVNQAQTIRERLLATLAFFFGAVALLLSGVGLYGVLNYSVQQQEREIGIRMALGAQIAHVVRQVTAGVSLAVTTGVFAGLVCGLAVTRYIQSLLYQVRPTDLVMLAVPCLIILAVACMAAAPALLRAIHVDPSTMLRAD